MAAGYGTVTNAVGSYYHEFIDFKNIIVSTPISTPTVSLPTATGWTQQSDCSAWTQNDFNVTIMGNANVVTRDGTTLPKQAAASIIEMLAIETQDDSCNAAQTESIQALSATPQPSSAPTIQQVEVPLAAKTDGTSTTAMQSAVFEMALQPENFFELDAMPNAAKREMVFTHDHFDHTRWDENLFAFLADEQMRQHRKKDKWFGDDDGDDWLAEFEKLALLELKR
jgi:hypothetical protein